MALQYAFWIAGRAGGIAQRRCGVLVKTWPRVFVTLVSQQLFIANQIWHIDGRHRVRFAQCDIAPYAGQMWRELFNQRRERHVEEDVAALGIINDETDLFGEQSRVHSVQNGATACDAKIDLQVSVVIPGQRDDTLTAAYAQTLQHVGDPTSSSSNRRPIAANDRSLH